ncbi:MAG: OmpH family outer membrane protein [Phycisphaerae bacterium]|nr:OmpH family outer membrane protein [Phycisphaerae bacterium]
MKTPDRLALYALLGVGLFALSRPLTALPESGDQSPRIAVCSSMKIVDDLMETERFKPARLEVEAQAKEDLLKPIADLLRDIEEEAKGLKEDDPRLRELGERHRSLQRQGQQATQEVARRVEIKVAEQLIECYQLVRASAVAVAEEKGFNYVLASTDSDAPMKTEPVMKIVRDFLARPVILAPKEVDITDDVRTDLKLE